MSTWYEFKVKYMKLDAHGAQKSVTEAYLIDAVSFTECEARATETLAEFISGEFKILAISTANYSEIISEEEGDRYFKCKLSMLTLDEEKGVEKKVNSYILVLADSCKDAQNRLEESLKGIVVDYEIPSISESKILDIFPYTSN